MSHSNPSESGNDWDGGSTEESKGAEAGRDDNVGALIAKSKKVASSIFTLLHAKNCSLSADRCSHPGCQEAKLMHLHLKTCTATGFAECPRGRKGCVDARKLLAHHRRCREIRARNQTGGPVRSQQHVCLVCSLVARYARGSGSDNLDRPSVGCSTARPGGKVQQNSSANSPTSASGMLKILTQPKLGAAICHRSITPPSTKVRMAPPPPRFAFSGGSKRGADATNSPIAFAAAPGCARRRAGSFDSRHHSRRAPGVAEVGSTVSARGDSGFETGRRGEGFGELGEVSEGANPPQQRHRRRRSMSVPGPPPSSSLLLPPPQNECGTIFEDSIDDEFKSVVS